MVPKLALADWYQHCTSWRCSRTILLTFGKFIDAKLAMSVHASTVHLELQNTASRIIISAKEAQKSSEHETYLTVSDWSHCLLDPTN